MQHSRSLMAWECSVGLPHAASCMSLEPSCCASLPVANCQQACSFMLHGPCWQCSRHCFIPGISLGLERNHERNTQLEDLVPAGQPPSYHMESPSQAEILGLSCCRLMTVKLDHAHETWTALSLHGSTCPEAHYHVPASVRP